MKQYAQFYTRDQRTGKLQFKLGTTGIFILDARRNLSNQIIDTENQIQRLSKVAEIAGYSLHNAIAGRFAPDDDKGYYRREFQDLPSTKYFYKVGSGLGGIFWLEYFEVSSEQIFFKVFNPKTDFHGMILNYPISNWRDKILGVKPKGINSALKIVNGTIRCNNCYWCGNEEDLIRGEDEDGIFDGCPNCDTDHYLMDI